MKVSENIDLSSLSYLKIGGQGKILIEIEKESEIPKLMDIKNKERSPLFVIGDCANTVFKNGFHNKIFVKITIDEILKTYEDKAWVNIVVGAGTNWDDLVKWTVKKRFSGLELLSGIPGTVGASPIQNIGAYGSEVSKTITHIKIFDLETENFYEINNKDCQFGYRDSVLKHNIGKFIITQVSFRLSKKKPEMPKYRDLSVFFLKTKNKIPTIKQIRDAVLEIRKEKLPDPKEIPNCGSFFKNPIVDNLRAEELLSHFPDMPQFQISEDEVKLSGGWLIEKSGFKGKEFNNLKVFNKNAIILTSSGKASFRELENIRDKITNGVEKNFSVHLEPEVNFIT